MSLSGTNVVNSMSLTAPNVLSHNLSGSVASFNFVYTNRTEAPVEKGDRVVTVIDGGENLRSFKTALNASTQEEIDLWICHNLELKADFEAYVEKTVKEYLEGPSMDTFLLANRAALVAMRFYHFLSLNPRMPQKISKTLFYKITTEDILKGELLPMIRILSTKKFCPRELVKYLPPVDEFDWKRYLSTYPITGSLPSDNQLIEERKKLPCLCGDSMDREAALALTFFAYFNRLENVEGSISCLIGIKARLKVVDKMTSNLTFSKLRTLFRIKIMERKSYQNMKTLLETYKFLLKPPFISKATKMIKLGAWVSLYNHCLDTHPLIEAELEDIAITSGTPVGEQVEDPVTTIS